MVRQLALSSRTSLRIDHQVLELEALTLHEPSWLPFPPLDMGELKTGHKAGSLS
jgi:hypothetical protein